MTREEMNSGSLNNCNIFELTSFVLRDLELTWRMVSKAFPTVEVLEDRDRVGLTLKFFALKTGIPASSVTELCAKIMAD